MNLRNVSIRATGTWQPRKGGHVDIRLSASVSLEELAQWLKIDKTEQPEVSIFLGPDDPETAPCEHCNVSVDVETAQRDEDGSPFCEKCWNDPEVWAGDPEALKEIRFAATVPSGTQAEHLRDALSRLDTPEDEIEAIVAAKTSRLSEELTDHLPDGDRCGFWKRNGVEAYCALHLGHRPKKGEPTHAWSGPQIPARPTEGETNG